MARTSKLLTSAVVKEAQAGLDSLGHNGLIAIKLKAILSAEKNGITTVAKVFGTTKATLISWIKRLDESIEQLAVQPGRGRKYLLSPEEEAVVKDWISNDSQLTIDHLKIKIEEGFGKSLGRSSVHRLMKRLSFSYITPRPRHHKQDSELLESSKKKSHANTSERAP